jgi:hypothetical protein
MRIARSTGRMFIGSSLRNGSRPVAPYRSEK